MTALKFDARSEEDSDRLALAIASLLAPGDLVTLDGALGAGKTTLVRLIARHAGFQGPVLSPTFTFANFYQAPSMRILHADAYRIGSIDEFADLGLDEYMDECVTFVEWGELISSVYAPHLAIRIDFADHGDDSRTFTIVHRSPKYGQIIDLLHSRKDVVV